MAATQTDVTNYINYIRQELSRYGDKLANLHQQGNKPSFAKEVKFMLLQNYVDIAEHWLEQWDSTTDDNFFTPVEFKDIMRHINAICNSFLWLELEDTSRYTTISFLERVFTALWYPVSGTEMTEMFGGESLILSTAPGQEYIPATYTGTITAPDVASYKIADVNNVLYNSSGTPNPLFVNDLIDEDLERIPVKYDSLAPHHIRMIGLFNPTVYPTLTDEEKEQISDYMNLWVFYWGVWYDAGSVSTENRTI